MTESLRLAGNIGLLVFFAIAVTQLGFYIGVPVYLALHMAYLGVRPWWLIAAVAAGVTGAFYALFDIALKVPVPTGALW